MLRSYSSLAYRGRSANPGILRGRYRPASSPDHIKIHFFREQIHQHDPPPPSTPFPAASPVVATAPSHRDAITPAHPADDSPATAFDSSVTLFFCHYDTAAGNVLTLAPSLPPRRFRPPSPSPNDDQKRLRSPAARARASVARTPSGRSRKRATRMAPVSSPRRAARAITSAVASTVAVVLPPAVVPTSLPLSSSVADVFSTPSTDAKKR